MLVCLTVPSVRGTIKEHERWFAWLRRLFCDALNITLFVAGFLFLFFRSPALYVFAGICLALAFIRAFSTDRAARYRENQKFTSLFSRMKPDPDKAAQRRNRQHVKPVYAGQPGESTLRAHKRPKSDAEHKVYKCPKCKQALRVPRGKGKILITCSQCGHQFTKKT